MNSFIAKFLLVASFVLCASGFLFAEDNDRDGLSDEFEQQLLQKFFPRFHVSARECDGFPAEFQPASGEPRALKGTATIHGQVFPVTLPDRAGFHIEVHFYHLWNRDCGLNGHPLDAEHVSALLFSTTDTANVDAWKAVYWYAAAHEDTACDASHAAQSFTIDAEQHGPDVWISEGKHASFLSLGLCRGGCGGDRCADMRPISSANLLNIGELGAPMNGSIWIDSPKWPLAAKMRSDFTQANLLQVTSAKSPGIVAVHESHAPLKAVVLGGSSGAGAMIAADGKTNDALNSAGSAAEKSLDASKKSVGDSVKSAFRSVWKFLSDSSNKKQ